MRVKATREGLLGAKTASGYLIDKFVPFVALPSTSALGKFVRITNPANGKKCIAVVLDVGPWNEHDDSYVFGGQRPRAEQGFHVVYKNGVGTTVCNPEHVNGSGIDLGECVWNALGMTDNSDVEWEFLLI
jgi:hypothetical protein